MRRATFAWWSAKNGYRSLIEAKTRNLLYRGLADLRSRLEAAGISPESVT